MIISLTFISNAELFSQNAAISKQVDSVQIDKSQLKVEPVPSRKIENFRKDKDFIYELLPIEQFNLMSYIWYWISKFLAAIFSDRGAAPYIRLLVIIAAITFIIFRIFKSNLSGIFSLNKKSKTDNGFEYFDEDIHTQDLDKKLDQAILERNFRDAIRFYYLKLLKQLDMNQVIQWEISKTNSDYQQELKNHALLNDFKALSGVYEYTWYGKFNVDQNHFESWQADFLLVLKQMNKR